MLLVVNVAPLAVTEIGPVFAPLGTTACSCVVETTLTLAETVPLNLTVVPPLTKFAPSITTLERLIPMVGEKSVTMGAVETINPFVLVALPALVVTVIGPFVVPTGTVAFTWVCEATVPATDEEPANLTVVAPVTKLAPNMATVVPAAPEGGMKLEMAGATRKLLLVVMVVAPIVRPKGPVVAPSGTTVCRMVSEITMKSAGVGLLGLNSMADVAESPVPVMVMILPGCPEAGKNAVILEAADICAPAIAIKK